MTCRAGDWCVVEKITVRDNVVEIETDGFSKFYKGTEEWIKWTIAVWTDERSRF